MDIIDKLFTTAENVENFFLQVSRQLNTVTL